MEAAQYIFKTELGWVGISSSANGLRRLSLPQQKYTDARRILNEAGEPASGIPPALGDIAERLNLYFKGYKVAFPDKLDLAGATDFQRKVWEATRQIPYGETRSYTWVAERVGVLKAVRAAGQALGNNPLPVIVPCHRVIGRDGGLGGYSGGLELKRYLLWLEASAFMRDRI